MTRFHGAETYVNLNSLDALKIGEVGRYGTSLAPHECLLTRPLIELGKNERPIYPPKIRSVRIVDNPFDDIVPRITAAEKQAQRRARDQAQKEREEAARRKGAKK